MAKSRDLWMEFLVRHPDGYLDCGLCNRGVIQNERIEAPCICPNGRAMKRSGVRRRPEPPELPFQFYITPDSPSESILADD